MNSNKQLHEVSLIGQLLSMEALLMLMGLVSLIYGIAKNSLMNILLGLFIIPGVFILVKARRARRLKRQNQ